MSSERSGLLFLVLGATGGTGQHFVAQALREGHRVRALVRSPAKLSQAASVEVVVGSVTDLNVDTDALVAGVDYVVAMVGDKEVQQTTKICLNFVRRLVPSMRQAGSSASSTRRAASASRTKAACPGCCGSCATPSLGHTAVSTRTTRR